MGDLVQLWGKNGALWHEGKSNVKILYNSSWYFQQEKYQISPSLPKGFSE